MQIIHIGLDVYWSSRNTRAQSAKEMCRLTQFKREEPKLMIYDLQSAFMILAMGLGIAFAAFLLEIGYYKATFANPIMESNYGIALLTFH